MAEAVEVVNQCAAALHRARLRLKAQGLPRAELRAAVIAETMALLDAYSRQLAAEGMGPGDLAAFGFSVRSALAGLEQS